MWSAESMNCPNSAASVPAPMTGQAVPSPTNFVGTTVRAKREHVVLSTARVNHRPVRSTYQRRTHMRA